MLVFLIRCSFVSLFVLGPLLHELHCSWSSCAYLFQCQILASNETCSFHLKAIVFASLLSTTLAALIFLEEGTSGSVSSRLSSLPPFLVMWLFSVVFDELQYQVKFLSDEQTTFSTHPLLTSVTVSGFYTFPEYIVRCFLLFRVWRFLRHMFWEKWWGELGDASAVDGDDWSGVFNLGVCS